MSVTQMHPDHVRVGDRVYLYPFRDDATGTIVALRGEDFGGRSAGGRMDTHFLLRHRDVLFEHEFDGMVRVID